MTHEHEHDHDHDHIQHNLTERFNFTGKARNTFIAISGIGLLLVIIGLFVHAGQWNRFWTNLLLSNFYFLAFSVLAVAFISIQYLAHGGWAVGFKRILEAIASYMPIAFIGFVIIIIGTFIGHNHGMKGIFEWTHLDADGMMHHADGSSNYDAILHGKSGYLNTTFFIIRCIFYFALWILFSRGIRKASLKEDIEAGMHNYHRQVKLSAGFLPIFGLTFCLASFDWLMSVQPHWYSTIFGVNVFAGALVGCMTVTNIIIILLKRQGLMSYVTENHIHDISKFMFAFSIFWTYTWLSQYLLIWYANLPEETPYYFTRLHGFWKPIFTLNFVLNFICPFLLFMMRDAKRNMKWVLFVSALLLIGRFIDWYLIVMPPLVDENSGFGLFEIGFFMLFGGIFCFSIGNALSKANLVPQHHPYLPESLHHEV
jgi:hypothetical protein